MGELSVYSQLAKDTNTCLQALKREIGAKSACAPLAMKIVAAMHTLNIQTEQDAIAAANTLLSGLQTLYQGGIIADDYDKIDFVKRGNTIVPSARVEAFYRAAGRKGYRITDSIIAVPSEDANTTYFKENFYNGDIIYTLEDRRYNADRAVNADRVINKYFAKVICRMDVHESQTNKRVAMSVCEMPIDEILAVAATSEQGFYISKWEEYSTKWGKKKRKVITNELNTSSFWTRWTGEMVNKTIIRRALKRIKEVLPELKETIYAFEQDTYNPQEETHETEPAAMLELPIETENVNMDKLTAEQQADCREMYDIFVANPKLAEEKANEIKAMFDGGADRQTVINAEYASIVCLKNSKCWGKIKEYFDDEKN